MKKQLTACYLIVLLIALLNTGCTKESSSISKDSNKSNTDDKESTEEVVLTAFFKNELIWDTAVAEEITRRTGVRLEYVSIAGDAEEKLNLMMVSDTLPDIITIDRGAAANDQYITNKKVIPLDELIETSGADIKEQLGDTMSKIRNKDDGKIYGIPSWFSNEVAPSAVFGFNIRMNYVKELGYYDTYIEKGYFTKDEFMNLLKEWKEKYPVINGHETIAMAFNSENEGDYTFTFKGMYGIHSYFQQDGKLFDNVRNPRMKEMYLFMNELYLEGLLDKDWPLTKKALYDEKISNGYVLSSPAAYWNIPNIALKIDAAGKEDIDNMMYPFLVIGEGVKPEETTYGPTSVLGWAYTYISSSNKNIEATMRLFNFLMSEEGQYLTQWGPEGYLWEMKDGVRSIKEDMIPELEKDMWGLFDKNGIRKYEILFKSGIAKDGQYYDMNQVFGMVTNNEDPVTIFANKYLGETAFDTTKFDDLGPDAGTPEALVKTNIDDLMKSMTPQIILAGSREEAEAIFDKLVQDAENAGLRKLEDICNEKYLKRLEIWGDVR